MNKEGIDKLIKKAKAVSEQAYAPYSEFRVGAALVTEKGNVFVGCNVENAAYGSTLCAERNAITTAIAEEGPAMKIRIIAVIVKGERSGPPCGACRQVISEFSEYSGDETLIVFKSRSGVETMSISELMPYKFEF